MHSHNKRIFLGIAVPADWKLAIHQFIEANKELHIRWIPPQNWHFTILFIGDFPANKLQSIYTLLEKCFAQIPAFEIAFDRFTYFPPKRPRMIWVKGKQSAAFDSVENLAYKTLKHFCEEVYMDFNAKPSKQAIPHITLSRLKFVRKPFHALEIPAVKFSPVSVKEIFLYESQLKATGSIYTKLATFKLKSV